LSINAIGNSGDNVLDLQGAHVVEAIVFLVTLKIQFSTYSHTTHSFIIQILSLASFYISFYFLSNYHQLSEFTKLLGAFPTLMTSFINYALLFLESSGFIMLDVGLGFINRQI
jgi:hypothetical protein